MVLDLSGLCQQGHGDRGEILTQRQDFVAEFRYLLNEEALTIAHQVVHDDLAGILVSAVGSRGFGHGGVQGRDPLALQFETYALSGHRYTPVNDCRDLDGNAPAERQIGKPW